MKLLISLEEIDNGAPDQLFPIECEKCHCIFHRDRRLIRKALKGNSLRFCSRVCSYGCRGSSAEYECTHCQQRFKKRSSQAKRTKNHFCSKSCAAVYNNAHKTKGTRRSKLEIWIEMELTKRYAGLEIQYCRKDTINSELDIYLPDLKLAFELNGIFHYEPIFGVEKLVQTKNNDDRKWQACLERGIELCIIDTSSLINFKATKAQRYLDIITGLIDHKAR